MNSIAQRPSPGLASQLPVQARIIARAVRRRAGFPVPSLNQCDRWRAAAALSDVSWARHRVSWLITRISSAAERSQWANRRSAAVSRLSASACQRTRSSTSLDSSRRPGRNGGSRCGHATLADCLISRLLSEIVRRLRATILRDLAISSTLAARRSRSAIDPLWGKRPSLGSMTRKMPLCTVQRLPPEMLASAARAARVGCLTSRKPGGRRRSPAVHSAMAKDHSLGERFTSRQRWIRSMADRCSNNWLSRHALSASAHSSRLSRITASASVGLRNTVP